MTPPRFDVSEQWGFGGWACKRLPHWGNWREATEGASRLAAKRRRGVLHRFAVPLLERRRVFAAAALVFTLPTLAHADAVGAFYERSVMAAANQRCGLFTPELASALAAAQAQARGAALRSGASNGTLAQVEARARGKVGAVACGSPDIVTAANRVRGAFAGYSRLQKMSFPGDSSDWMANRGVSRLEPLWKLSQTVHFGPNSLVFGLAGKDDARLLLAVANFPDNAQPYAARLILRDTAIATEPYLNFIQAKGGPLPLASRTPPRSATRGILAEARGAADPALLPAGARTGYAFRFPASAIGALAELDPREAVMIEFLIAAGPRDEVRTAYVEVGDFAAGRAFLVTAQR